MRPDGSLGRVYEIEMRRSLGVVLFGIAIVLVLLSCRSWRCGW